MPNHDANSRPAVTTWLRRTLQVAAIVILGGAFVQSRSAAEEARSIPPAASDVASADASTQTAVLAGGCFWGVQGVFQHVAGVTNAVSGYAGGASATAHYDKVGTGTTGHAEAVQVTYDPRKISYGQILRIFFSVAHDPTQLNRQGPDYGTQYRSAIFPANAEQARVAKDYIAQLDATGAYPSAIVTRIEPGHKFFAAEENHQDFMFDNPRYPYIVINDAPKVAALKRLLPAVYREKPVLVRDARAGN
jgi:peptide-methionine (S)-S-oxide reductase